MTAVIELYPLYVILVYDVYYESAYYFRGGACQQQTTMKFINSLKIVKLYHNRTHSLGRYGLTEGFG